MGQVRVVTEVGGTTNRGTRDLAGELNEPGHGAIDTAVVDAAFETSRSLGAKTEALGREGDGHRSEPRRLQQHRAGLIGDLGGFAAHNAGDADSRPLGVTDKAVVRIEGALDVVESDERLPRLRLANRQPAAGQPGQVVRVRR